MLIRRPPFDPQAYLAGLHTRQLLKLRKSVYRVHGGELRCAEKDALFSSENGGDQITSAQIKAELATRPHIPNKPEAGAVRRDAARRAQGGGKSKNR